MNLAAYQSVLPNGSDYTTPWLKISSTAFRHGGILPSIYRSEGLNINPSLRLTQVPESTKSLVVMLLDIDAPIRPRLHWMCWDLPPTTQIQINEKRGTNGVNDFQLFEYTGPCVSSTHKYFFKIYALDTFLYLPPTANQSVLDRAILTSLLGQGSILFFSSPLN